MNCSHDKVNSSLRMRVSVEFCFGCGSRIREVRAVENFYLWISIRVDDSGWTGGEVLCVTEGSFSVGCE
jgi:hypothetical protein